MTATQTTEVQSQVAGLSTEAFTAFCKDISGMFGVGMKCAQMETGTETVEGLKKHFQQFSAVISINAKGALNGTFQLIFDRHGLFILGNLMIMPEKMISLVEKAVGSQKMAKDIKNGSLKEAEEIGDAVAEAGNLMVGSWDRVFREGLNKHEHFLQSDTFIGDPWANPEESIGVASDEEFLFVLYKMAAGSYPPFMCGVIFPKAIFTGAENEAKIRAEARAKVLAEAGEKARAEAEEKEKADAEKKLSEEEMKVEIEAEERARIEAETKAKAETETKAEAEVEDKTDIETEAKAEAEKQTTETASEQTETDSEEKADTETAEQAEQVEEGPVEETPTEEAAVEIEEEKEVETAETEPIENKKPSEQSRKPKPAKTPQTLSKKITMPIRALLASLLKKKISPSFEAGSKKQAVSEFTKKIFQTQAIITDLSDNVPSEICAKDIMQKDIVWVSCDDSVQLVLAKMQQGETGYVLVGTDDQLEGIVSRSDITGALSIYLRPMFANKRSPLDDATLKIRVKWIMTRPVHAIKPETSLDQIMDNICRLGYCALPVVDQNNKVLGLVTVFDIYKTFLNKNQGRSRAGKIHQTPPLVQLDLSAKKEVQNAKQR